MRSAYFPCVIMFLNCFISGQDIHLENFDITYGEKVLIKGADVTLGEIHFYLKIHPSMMAAKNGQCMNRTEFT